MAYCSSISPVQDRHRRVLKDYVPRALDRITMQSAFHGTSASIVASSILRSFQVAVRTAYAVSAGGSTITCAEKRPIAW